MPLKMAIYSIAFLLGTSCFADQTETPANDTQGVEQAVADFYTSLNVLFTGDATPMLNVWSHADDVTYMGPAGGFQVGWDQVRSNWESQAALNFGGKIEPFETRIIVGGDLAFVQCYEQGTNLDEEGQPVSVSIRATSEFRKENGVWKMIGHHTDLQSNVEERTAEAQFE